MITEVKHIAITPMYPEEDFLRKVENFFEGVKKALIIRLDEAFYTQDLVAVSYTHLTLPTTPYV